MKIKFQFSTKILTLGLLGYVTLAGGLSTALAQDTTWTGAINADYNNLGNWTNGVPSSNDAFIGAGATLSTSDDVSNLHRLNLQNTSGLLTLGHSMIAERLDDNHPSLVGNGSYGNLKIVNGGSLTLTGDSSLELFNLHGFSGVSTVTVDGGTLLTTDATKRFSVGRNGNQGTKFTLDSGMVNIAGRVDVGDGTHAKGEMNLNGGSFSFGGHFVVANNDSFTGGGQPGGVVNIDGASVLGTGSGLAIGVRPLFRIGNGDHHGTDRGLVNLKSGSLELATGSRMELGRDGGGGSPSGVGRFVMSGGDFYAPGENAFVLVRTGFSSPSNTINGIPVDGNGNINQSGGTAWIEGELRIGAGSLSGTSTLGGVYIHRGGEMTVSNASGTGLLRIALASQWVISGGTITADRIQIDARQLAGPGVSAKNPASLHGGGGTIVGNVDVAGSLSPGFQASFSQNTTTGTLNIFGDLTLSETAETFFDFKNPSLTAGTFDSIFNDGTDTVTFDGALTLRFFGGEYQPGTVDLFANFAQYVGDFDSVTITGLTHGEVATFDASNGTLTIGTIPEPTIVGQFVNHGGYSGSGSAIDTGKVLAKEGAAPTLLTYDNLINTSRGINGVVFDIENLAGTVTAADFIFQMSPTGAFDLEANPVGSWASAPAPSSVTVTPGSPDRMSIVWPDNAIANRWLRITVLASTNTGLVEPEVYYIGHLLGEITGPSGSVFTVSFADITPIRSAVGSTVDASSTVDIDKNGTVAFADISAMRPNVGAQLTIITIPASGGGG